MRIHKATAIGLCGRLKSVYFNSTITCCVHKMHSKHRGGLAYWDTFQDMLFKEIKSEIFNLLSLAYFENFKNMHECT